MESSVTAFLHAVRPFGTARPALLASEITRCTRSLTTDTGPPCVLASARLEHDMTSKKARRYGQGGSNHKKNPNLDRPNGKAWKKISRTFDSVKRRLVRSV